MSVLCSYLRSLLGAPTSEDHSALQAKNEQLEQQIEELRKELDALKATTPPAPAT